MAMRNPLHPGISVLGDCLKSLGLSVTKGAEILGVRHHALNYLVNEKAGI
jgi:antitoxin HigA-1